MIASRMSQIDSSGIRKVFDLAAKIKNPVNLSIGQPDFDVPGEIKEVAIESIEKGFNHYTPTQGIPELRDRLSQDLKEKQIQFDELFVTSGVSGGILLAFMTLLNPGDEVLIADPYFVMYKHLVNLVGGKPVFVDTYPDFKMTAECIEKHLTPKTKMVALNTPANPTGVTLSEEEVKEIADLLKEKNIVVLSDEIYDQFIYDDKQASVGRYHPLTLTMGGFSKTYGMTGWRLGYTAGPKEIIQEMVKLQQFSFVCAPSFAQKAGVAAMDFPMNGKIDDYKRKRDWVYDELKDHYNVTKPGGAFYFFPEAPDQDADAFVKKALERELLIIPGNVFSEKNSHFRISFSASDETLKKGLQILKEIS